MINTNTQDEFVRLADELLRLIPKLRTAARILRQRTSPAEARTIATKAAKLQKAVVAATAPKKVARKVVRKSAKKAAKKSAGRSR